MTLPPMQQNEQKINYEAHGDNNDDITAQQNNVTLSAPIQRLLSTHTQQEEQKNGNDFLDYNSIFYQHPQPSMTQQQHYNNHRQETIPSSTGDDDHEFVHPQRIMLQQAILPYTFTTGELDSLKAKLQTAENQLLQTPNKQALMVRMSADEIRTLLQMIDMTYLQGLSNMDPLQMNDQYPNDLNTLDLTSTERIINEEEMKQSNDHESDDDDDDDDDDDGLKQEKGMIKRPSIELDLEVARAINEGVEIFNNEEDENKEIERNNKDELRSEIVRYKERIQILEKAMDDQMKALDILSTKQYNLWVNNKGLMDRNEYLEKEVMNVNKKLDALKDYSGNMDIMNVEELNLLEWKLKNRINKIGAVRQRIFENRFYCIICLSNQKNVVIEGCNHFDICDKCEQKLQRKVCPKCRTPFTNIIKLKL